MKKAFQKTTISAAFLTMALTVTQPAIPLLCQAGLPGLGLTIAVEAAVKYYPQCSSHHDSIVDALDSLGIDSSYSNRKKIAKVNGFSHYTGKASENIQLLKLLKKGKLIKSKTEDGTNYCITNGGEAVYNQAHSHLDKKYGKFDGLGFHWRAWCADFVSYCASSAGQSGAIPWKASVSDLRSAIKDAGGTEYSKSSVSDGDYVPVRGDIIIFKSDGASHVGIVDYTSDSKIYYIDGNNTTNGNGNKSCVHYSKCSKNDKRFTCVLKPNYH